MVREAQALLGAVESRAISEQEAYALLRAAWDAAHRLSSAEMAEVIPSLRRAAEILVRRAMAAGYVARLPEWLREWAVGQGLLPYEPPAEELQRVAATIRAAAEQWLAEHGHPERPTRIGHLCGGHISPVRVADETRGRHDWVPPFAVWSLTYSCGHTAKIEAPCLDADPADQIHPRWLSPSGVVRAAGLGGEHAACPVCRATWGDSHVADEAAYLVRSPKQAALEECRFAHEQGWLPSGSNRAHHLLEQTREKAEAWLADELRRAGFPPAEARYTGQVWGPEARPVFAWEETHYPYEPGEDAAWRYIGTGALDPEAPFTDSAYCVPGHGRVPRQETYSVHPAPEPDPEPEPPAKAAPLPYEVWAEHANHLHAGDDLRAIAEATADGLPLPQALPLVRQHAEDLAAAWDARRQGGQSARNARDRGREIAELIRAALAQHQSEPAPTRPRRSGSLGDALARSGLI